MESHGGGDVYQSSLAVLPSEHLERVRGMDEGMRILSIQYL
jgi:hypothetical protein